MARLPLSTGYRRRIKRNRLVLSATTLLYFHVFVLFALAYQSRCLQLERRLRRRELRAQRLFELIHESDIGCISELRVDRRTFHILCDMLAEVGGLRGTTNTELEEIVATFLYILAHHFKNRTIAKYFYRSGETISRNFNHCLLAVLKLKDLLLKKPEPIAEDSTYPRWRYFKNFLGALDGTHVKVTAPSEIKERYRSRKGNLVTNVLGVCAPDMQFIYVLAGSEGSAHDGRVLRDAISRPNGLQVPTDQYYLVDAGYTNCRGFLAPYRGQRYHLGGWTTQHPPVSAEEYFNMRHAKARNIVERCFGRVKKKWGILMGEFKGDLQIVSGHIGKMAAAAEREVEMQQKNTEDDPRKALNQKAMEELAKLGFTGSEIVRCARLFVKEPDEIPMMFALPENLRREYVTAMLQVANR